MCAVWSNFAGFLLFHTENTEGLENKRFTQRCKEKEMQVMTMFDFATPSRHFERNDSKVRNLMNGIACIPVVFVREESVYAMNVS